MGCCGREGTLSHALLLAWKEEALLPQSPPSVGRSNARPACSYTAGIYLPLSWVCLLINLLERESCLEARDQLFLTRPVGRYFWLCESLDLSCNHSQLCSMKTAGCSYDLKTFIYGW